MGRIINPGNLFVYAEKRLMKKVKKGEIISYSLLDIIDNAIKVRRYLDKYGKIIIPKMTPEEQRRNKKNINRRYYLKTRR